MERKLFTADFDDIKSGRVTDVYFDRTIKILKAKGIDKWVKAEFIAKSLPDDGEWGVFAGLEECSRLFEGMKINVRSMPEGTVFRAYQPVLEIEGMYTDFGIYETAILGFLCQASGIATKAARCKKAAGDRGGISFGARRMHPTIAPLVETLGDEKFETIAVAEAMGEKLYGVRLDTPASRRGNFLRILEEVRWELDLRGYKHVKLFVSGGLDEYKINELNPLVDAYGVGTAISSAKVVDFAMDIIEVEGKPLAKRGKMSGSKRVLRCDRCYNYVMIPLREISGSDLQNRDCPCGGLFRDILLSHVDRGKIIGDRPAAKEIRDYVLKQLRHISVPL